MKKILLLVGLVSSFAFGQDYYAPTDKDKEPLARFPIKFEVSSTYPRVMKYELPAELTGKVNAIELKEVSPETSAVRLFKNETTGSTATCMAKDVSNPGCVVTHKNLSLDKGLAEAAVAQKFMDPDLRIAANAINKKFILESGNEPIGFIGALNKAEDSTKWKGKLTNKWMTYFQYDRGIFRDLLINFGDLEDENGNKIDGRTYIYQDGKWTPFGILKNVHWTDHHVAGNWEIPGTKGWFDFTFNAESSKFEGTFAVITDANQNPPKQGQWNGTRL